MTAMVTFVERAALVSFAGVCGPRQTRWSSRDLRSATTTWRDLDADVYAKNVADSIPAKILTKIKEEIDAEG
jgi:hypothetical protein